MNSHSSHSLRTWDLRCLHTVWVTWSMIMRIVDPPSNSFSIATHYGIHGLFEMSNEYNAVTAAKHSFFGLHVCTLDCVWHPKEKIKEKSHKSSMKNSSRLLLSSSSSSSKWIQVYCMIVWERVCFCMDVEMFFETLTANKWTGAEVSFLLAVVVCWKWMSWK